MFARLRNLLSTPARIERLASRAEAQSRANERKLERLQREVSEHALDYRRRMKHDLNERRRIARLEARADAGTTARRLLDRPDFAEFYAVALPVVKSDRTLLGYDRLYVLWQAVRNAAGLQLPAFEIGS